MQALYSRTTYFVRRGALLGALLIFAAAAPALAGDERIPPVPPMPLDSPDYKSRLDEARMRLDEAARELALLHEKAARESVTKVVHDADRAMLGVIIDKPKGSNDVLIVGITPGSGAAAAGLKSGDLIVGLDDKKLADGSEHPHKRVGTIMSTVTPGDSVRVHYLRKGEPAVVKVVTQAHGAQMLRTGCKCDEDLLEDIKVDFSIDGDEFNFNGESLSGILRSVSKSIANVSLLESDTSGKFVTLEPDLAAYFDVAQGVLVVSPPITDLDIKAGDVIVEVAGRSVGSVGDVMGALKGRNEPTMVQLRRQGNLRQLLLTEELLSDVTAKVIRIDTSSGEPTVRIVRD